MAEAASRGGKSSSLVNNLAMPRERDYEAVCATAEDLFPWMANVEVCCLLEQQKREKDFIEIGINAEEYYRIKDSENDTDE